MTLVPLAGPLSRRSGSIQISFLSQKVSCQALLMTHCYTKLVIQLVFQEGGVMSDLNTTELTLELDENPEIRSFVYQQILEFEPYVTPQTIVAVIAKDPIKLLPKLQADGEEISKKDLSKMFRISITLKEDGTQIQEEALHNDVFEAIKLAKEKLIQKLDAIQNHVVSQSDRIEQINQALNNQQVH